MALHDVVILEGFAGTYGDAVKRVFGDVAGDLGDLRQQLVDIAQQGATARHNHAAIHDVGSELGRRFFENRANGIDDRGQRVGDRLNNLVGTERNRLGETGYLIAAPNVHRQLLLHRQCAADLDLYVFRRGVAYHQAVLTSNVVGDNLVDLHAAHTDSAVDDDVVEANDRNLRRSAADVDDHVAGGARYRYVRPDRGSDRLLDQESAFGACLDGSVVDGALLDTGDAGWDADHDLGAEHRHRPRN